MTKAQPTLSAAARGALRDALQEPLSYAGRALIAPAVPGSSEPRVLVLLGEAHMKLPKAWDLGMAVVDAFDLRGVEGLAFKRVLMGRLMWGFVVLPRLALRAVTFGIVKGSTIHYAMKRPSGETIRLEEMFPIPVGVHAASLYVGAFIVLTVIGTVMPWLAIGSGGLLAWVAALTAGAMMILQAHAMITIVPAFLFRRRAWAWMLNPFLGILAPRDKTMADGLAMMLAEREEATSALAIMGRAHLQGCEQILIESHGYRSVSLEDLLRD